MWQNALISRPGLFTEFQARYNKTQLIISGRLEASNAKANDPADEFTDVNPQTASTQINPGLSIGGINDLGKGYRLGLWLGRAQRSGSLAELFINYFPVGVDPYEMLGNPELKPEINNQADLNLGFKKATMEIEIDDQRFNC